MLSTPFENFPFTVIHFTDPVHPLLNTPSPVSPHVLQTRTTPCSVTSVMIRFWWSRRSRRVWAEKAGAIPPDALDARAAIPAAPAFPSVLPCCRPPCVLTSHQNLFPYVTHFEIWYLFCNCFFLNDFQQMKQAFTCVAKTDLIVSPIFWKHK